MWDVTTVEAQNGSLSGLVRVEQIAGDAVPYDVLPAALATLPGEIPAVPGTARVAPETIQAELDRVLESRPGDLAALCYSCSLATLTSSVPLSLTRSANAGRHCGAPERTVPSFRRARCS